MIIIKSQWQYSKPVQIIDVVVVYSENKNGYVVKCTDRNNIIRELGRYKDVARVKKVMEMIEERIRINYSNKAMLAYLSSGTVGANIQELRADAKCTAIFTMPKE